jgi:hypothetical protein
MLTDGAQEFAAAPSGASTGSREALELRDGDPKRYSGGTRVCRRPRLYIAALARATLVFGVVYWLLRERENRGTQREAEAAPSIGRNSSGV